VALVLLLVAIPALVWAGMRVILDSTDGQLVRRVTDPAAPGYEAVVEPTPTALVTTIDTEGTLDSAAVLALTADGTGGVLTIPADTLVEIPGGFVTLRFVHDTLGAEPYTAAVGNLLELTFSETATISASEWSGLVSAAAPIAVSSPDPVVGPTGAVVFPQGSIDLAADEVWPYLSGRGPRESDLARLVRVQAFWRAWLSEVGAAGPDALGIPTDTGLGRFLSGLSADQIIYETLPVTSVGADAEGREQFRVDPEAAAAALAAIIPFPEGAPGTRPRLRVLDGTGELNNGLEAAIVLAAAGAQIDVVGNARSFGQTVTQFVYYDQGAEGAARELRDALGVGEIVHSEQTNSATDLTVVLGEDYLAVVGPSGTVAGFHTKGGQGG